MPFGTELRWKVFRQTDYERAGDVLSVVDSTNYIFYILGAVVFLVAVCCGPLLPFWMFFNTMQLVAHLPMIRTHLPATTNIFILEYLSIVRLQQWSVHEWFTELVGISSEESR